MAAALVGLALAGCSDDKKNPTQPEEEIQVPTVTEVFRGQVQQFGSDCNEFSMANGGTIELQITELEPLQTITMGLSLGQVDPTVPTGCATFADDNSVRLRQTFASAGLAAGDYCTCVFDVGNIFPGATVDYTLEVTHPE